MILLTSNNASETKNDLRVLKLIPNLLCPLAVEPAIPSDYIALSPSGTLNPYEWIYWGPENVLKAYFADPTSLEEPVLRVQLSANVAQTGPNSFSGDESLEKMKKENPKGLASLETKWGDYPIRAIKAQIQGKVIYMAWVGLNDQTGWTLMFNLVSPDKQDHLENLKLWNNLITKTTQLKDGDYFKACGQDLQDGYTLVNTGGAKLKMLAEKRQSDGKIQVVILPESSDIEFHYEDMMECEMGAKWKYREPMVKVYGEIIIKNNNFESRSNYVTSIFFNSVTEFSFKKEDGQNPLIFQKICN